MCHKLIWQWWCLKLLQISLVFTGYVNLIRLISLVGRVFANGPRELGSIPGRVIPKTLKMVLDTSLLNTQQYKVCIKGKMEQSRERSNPPHTHTHTPQCRSYLKGSLLVALDYGRQLYFCLLCEFGLVISVHKMNFYLCLTLDSKNCQKMISKNNFCIN